MYQNHADDQLQRLLAIHQDRLRVLELQSLDHDPLRIPVGLLNEMKQARSEISALAAELERRAQQQARQPQAPRRCPGCTSDVPYGQQVCSHCGTQLRF
jgi:hypothetical protein